MSYDNEKKAFDRTAKRLLDSSRKSGKNISFRQAQNQLRTHLQKSNHKK
tara:strand:- start:5390 stop:5536 length:147 start_codon:yes stop_codon:yes gene_type:complete